MRTTLIAASLTAAMAVALPPVAWAAASPPPLPADALKEATWWIVIDGEKIGPLTDAAVERRLADGSLTDDTLVWREGMENWVPAKNAAGIQAVKMEASLNGRLPKKTPTDNKFGAGAAPLFIRFGDR